jgi:hypothetical protein
MCCVPTSPFAFMQSQVPKVVIGRWFHFPSNQNAQLWTYIILALVSKCILCLYFLPDISILAGSTKHDIYFSTYNYQKPSIMNTKTSFSCNMYSSHSRLHIITGSSLYLASSWLKYPSSRSLHFASSIQTQPRLCRRLSMTPCLVLLETQRCPHYFLPLLPFYRVWGLTISILFPILYCPN